MVLLFSIGTKVLAELKNYKTNRRGKIGGGSTSVGGFPCTIRGLLHLSIHHFMIEIVLRLGTAGVHADILYSL